MISDTAWRSWEFTSAYISLCLVHSHTISDSILFVHPSSLLCVGLVTLMGLSECRFAGAVKLGANGLSHLSPLTFLDCLRYGQLQLHYLDIKTDTELQFDT